MEEMKEVGIATAIPDWQEMQTWARNLGLRLTRNEYWADELASAAVARLFEKWEMYSDRPVHEFRAISATIMYRSMLRVLRDEKAKGTRLYSLDFVVDADEVVRNGTRYVMESKCLEHDSVARAEEIEGRVDLMLVYSAFFESLTPSEIQILTERVENPSATSDEVASWVGIRTGGAVRQHEMNIRRKAKSFINSHPNKIQRHMDLSSKEHEIV